MGLAACLCFSADIEIASAFLGYLSHLLMAAVLFVAMMVYLVRRL